MTRVVVPIDWHDDVEVASTPGDPGTLGLAPVTMPSLRRVPGAGWRLVMYPHEATALLAALAAAVHEAYSEVPDGLG